MFELKVIVRCLEILLMGLKSEVCSEAKQKGIGISQDVCVVVVGTERAGGARQCLDY
jgi:hypothetical protein